ncbi:hypothetical protein BT96DRAFT_1027089 [Gymnopus androsaceus JB14]|uniref:Nuclear pore protein n=1 Tax=Gymnopus androsaceus JB14 TaxID=1447944 RepID=A0A6A4GE60_9AGAR|nr:hypothetical protein BT96DRAFT_1027089 [Gymnopus androsaceus JB14]
MLDGVERSHQRPTSWLTGERISGANLWSSCLLVIVHPQVEAVHLANRIGVSRFTPGIEQSRDTLKMGVCNDPLATFIDPSLASQPLSGRYIRQFVKMDPKEALQYVYILPLSSDSTSPVGQEQLEAAWELVRRIIVLGNSGPSTNTNGNTNSALAWEELVGGVRPDGTRFVIWCPPKSPSLLHLSPSSPSSNFPSSVTPHRKHTLTLQTILLPTASLLLSNDRLPEAIKLYDLAGEYDLVVGCLADALGRVVINLGSFGSSSGAAFVGAGSGSTAREILGVYERLGRGTGSSSLSSSTSGLSSSMGHSPSSSNAPKNRLACIQLLKILDAAERGKEGHVERALEVLEGTGLIPIDEGVVGTGSASSSAGARTVGGQATGGDLDVVKITRKAEEFSSLHESVQRCLPVYMVLCMDALVAVAQRVKGGGGAFHSSQSQHHLTLTLSLLRKKSRAVMVYAGLLKYRMSPEVYGYLSRGDVEVAL